MFEIPTFEVGERVRLHWKPYEFLCPVCHGTPFTGTIEPHSILSTVIEHTPRMTMPTCNHSVPFPDGWYTVENERGEIAVPYTLLEKLEVTL